MNQRNKVGRRPIPPKESVEEAQDETLVDSAPKERKSRNTDNAHQAQRSPSADKRAAKAHTTKCIYFRDQNTVDELEKIASRHSRGSVSGIIEQLVEQLIVNDLDPKARRISFEAEVYL